MIVWNANYQCQNVRVTYLMCNDSPPPHSVPQILMWILVAVTKSWNAFCEGRKCHRMPSSSSSSSSSNRRLWRRWLLRVQRKEGQKRKRTICRRRSNPSFLSSLPKDDGVQKEINELERVSSTWMMRRRHSKYANSGVEDSVVLKLQFDSLSCFACALRSLRELKRSSLCKTSSFCSSEPFVCRVPLMRQYSNTPIIGRQSIQKIATKPQDRSHYWIGPTAKMFNR